MGLELPCKMNKFQLLINIQFIHALLFRDDTDEYVWDHYEESVPMSTYLVAFVVSDFEYELSPPTGNNVQFRIWARKNALDQVEYAKSIGAKMLKYFEDYFQVKYPLPKQVRTLTKILMMCNPQLICF